MRPRLYQYEQVFARNSQSPSPRGGCPSGLRRAEAVAVRLPVYPAQLQDVLKVNAAYGDSWIQVRKDGATGSVLYTGTLTKGHSKKFKNKVLWVRLGSPSMVKLVVEGKTQAPLSGLNPADYIVKNGKAKKAS